MSDLTAAAARILLEWDKVRVSYQVTLVEPDSVKLARHVLADLEDEAHLQTIDERDAAADFADKLAYAIGGDAIGEHSNLNCPWQNALDIAEQRLANRPIEADHPESTCEHCGGLNVSWHVESPLWNQVVRSEGDYEPMLCPRCFAVRAYRAGIDKHWILSIENLADLEEWPPPTIVAVIAKVRQHILARLRPAATALAKSHPPDAVHGGQYASMDEMAEDACLVGAFLLEVLDAAEREDDGERLTPEWMAEQLGQKLGYRPTIWVNGAVNIVGDVAWCAGEQLCSMEYRFQFRRLCQCLGVTLKEPQ